MNTCISCGLAKPAEAFRKRGPGKTRRTACLACEARAERVRRASRPPQERHPSRPETLPLTARQSIPALRGDWGTEAACLGLDDDTMFPEYDRTRWAAYKAQVAAAKAICAGCDVREECLRAGLAQDDPSRGYRHGIWGGLTGPERERLVG